MGEMAWGIRVVWKVEMEMKRKEDDVGEERPHVLDLE